jgi:hypothetical protein
MMGRRTAEDRCKGARKDTFFQGIAKLLVGDGLPFQIAFDQRIIGLGHIFDECFPLCFHRVLHVGGDLDFEVALPLPSYDRLSG